MPARWRDRGRRRASRSDCRGGVNVAAEGFDEEQFGEFGEDESAAGMRGADLVDGEADGVFEPLAGGFFDDVYFEYLWQAGEKDFAKLRIADHVAADEPCDLAATAKAGELEALCRVFGEHLEGVHRLYCVAVSEKVRVTVGDDHDVSGG